MRIFVYVNKAQEKKLKEAGVEDVPRWIRGLIKHAVDKVGK